MTRIVIDCINASARRIGTGRLSGRIVPRRYSEEDHAAAVRFYVELMNGRQVWHADVVGSPPCLWFSVDRQMIAVPLDPAAERRTTVLAVPDPAAVAARCWDAGYSVLVCDVDRGEPLEVEDPFGHRVRFVEG